jgi:hypothetical protein
MKLLKAIVSGIILYAVIFLAASAMLSLSETTFGFRMYITVILAAVLTFIVSKYFYFKNMQVASPVKEGVLLGLTLVIVMFIIEVPVMTLLFKLFGEHDLLAIYGFAKDLGWAYFNTWHILLGYGLTLITPVFAAPRKFTTKKLQAPKRKTKK